MSHDGGVAKVPYEFMPTEWQKAVPHDEEEAKAFREKTSIAAMEATREIHSQAAARESEEMENGPLPEGILTKEDVLKAWMAASDPANVSNLYHDPNNKPYVGGRSAGGGSYTKQYSPETDAQKLRAQVARHYNALMSGRFDTAAEIAALNHNIPLYEKAGQADRADQCRHELGQLARGYANPSSASSTAPTSSHQRASRAARPPSTDQE